MADQITEVSTRRGLDIRDFTLLVGGGAGPVHAAHIAATLGIPTVVLPRYSALYSAFGMLAMDIGRELVRSYVASAADLDLEQLAHLYAAMEQEAVESLRASQIEADAIVFSRTADMRYAGQFHAVEVALPHVPRNHQDVEQTVAAFEARHRELYSFDLPFRAAEFMLFRLRASVPQPPLDAPPAESGPRDPSAAFKRGRRCFLDGRWIDLPCFDGERLRANNVLSGPAIIEEKTTTVLVPAGFTCTVDRGRSYILRGEGARGAH